MGYGHMIKNQKINKKKYFYAGEFTSTVGIKLDGYWNFRPMLANMSDLDVFFLELYKRLPCNFAGLEFFGAISAVYVVARIGVDRGLDEIVGHAIWRKTPDRTGQEEYRNFITNELRILHPIYIIDDVFTTGSSVKKIIERYRREGHMIKEIIVLKNLSNMSTFMNVPIKEI